MARDLILGRTARNWATGQSSPNQVTSPPRPSFGARHPYFTSWTFTLLLFVGLPAAIMLGSDYGQRRGFFKNQK